MAIDEVQWLTADERAAWLSIAGLVVRLPGALDSQLQTDDEISFFEYMVMSVLSEQADRTLQMSDIAAASSSSLSRLSHTVKRLEGQGFVERHRVPGAGRRTAATLTDAGMDKVVQAAPGHVQRVRDLLIDALSPAQLQGVREAVDVVLTRIAPDSSC